MSCFCSSVYAVEISRLLWWLHRYLSADRDATMSILDVSLLTGFVVDENDLKAVCVAFSVSTHLLLPYWNKPAYIHCMQSAWSVLTFVRSLKWKVARLSSTDFLFLFIAVHWTRQADSEIWDEQAAFRARIPHNLPGQGLCVSFTLKTPLQKVFLSCPKSVLNWRGLTVQHYNL